MHRCVPAVTAGRAAGCALGVVRAITSPKRALLEVVAANSAPSLRRTHVADAVLTATCAQARVRRGSDKQEASVQLA